MDWLISTLQAPMTAVFWGLIRTPEAQRDTAAIEAGRQKSEALYAILDRHLEGRKYVAGDRLSMGDIPLGAMTYRWYGMPMGRPERPNVRAWYERLTERPAFQEHVMVPIT
jgi:glutathione S-transferase